MKFILQLASLLFLLSLPEGLLLAQKSFPKREMRAAWIASVENIDWPSKRGLSPEEQKAELIKLLDKLRDVGINTIALQIRPSSDALYDSQIEPWSKFLSGKQGISPKPVYDPLEFAIEECHKRLMELHAWFNPYRVGKVGDAETDNTHISKLHPEWIITYGKYKVLDPGLPQTREYVTRVITDVVRRYDVDAIHIDDYFYPYKIKGLEFNDKASFAANPRGFKPNQKEDWRRDNVNLIIKMLHDSIHTAKPYVKFGVSPFGIWRNKSSDPRGSDTKGGQNYDDLYADILLWLKNRWVDYIVPQLYWHIGMKTADYKTLAKWWATNSNGIPLYIGHGIYRLSEKNRAKEWSDGKEIQRQIILNRQLPEIEGSFFFSAKSFLSNPMGINEKLKADYYRYPALIPTIPGLSTTPPSKPVQLSAKRGNNEVKVSWNAGSPSESEAARTKYYVVYLLSDDTDISNPANIYTLTRDTTISIPRKTAQTREKIRICITAVNRLNNESEPSDIVTIKL